MRSTNSFMMRVRPRRGGYAVLKLIILNPQYGPEEINLQWLAVDSRDILRSTRRVVAWLPALSRVRASRGAE